MLANVKLLLGIASTDTSKDGLLTLLIDNATAEVLQFTHLEALNAALERAVVLAVVYNYNRLGSEGVDGENYSGVSFTYASDYPDNIKRILYANRKVRVVK